jgi:hypothetical protein
MLRSISLFDCNKNPIRRHFNSIIYVEQERHARSLQSANKKRKISTSRSAVFSNDDRDIYIPSSLSTEETNTALLVIVLVREATHLIYYALSSHFDHAMGTVEPQQKDYTVTLGGLLAVSSFEDIGHMMRIVWICYPMGNRCNR